MKEYLLKFPIAATTRRRNSKHPVHAMRLPGYGYLAFDKRNHSHIYVNLHDADTHRHYNVQISKYYLMEAILYSLMIRPIRKPNNHNFWINKQIFESLNVTPENLNYEAAVEYNKAALNRLEKWLYIDLTDKERSIARTQHDLILDRLKSIDFIDPATTVNAITTLSDVL